MTEKNLQQQEKKHCVYIRGIESGKSFKKPSLFVHIRAASGKLFHMTAPAKLGLLKPDKRLAEGKINDLLVAPRVA